MPEFNLTAIQRSVVAMVASLVFSATCVGAAVAPAGTGQVQPIQLVRAA
jgi:hypothetical protein